MDGGWREEMMDDGSWEGMVGKAGLKGWFEGMVGKDAGVDGWEKWLEEIVRRHVERGW